MTWSPAASERCPGCGRPSLAGSWHDACSVALELAADRTKGIPDHIASYVDRHGRKAAHVQFTVAYSSEDLLLAWQGQMKKGA